MKVISLIFFSLIQLMCNGQVQFQKTFSFGNRTFGQNIIQSMDHGWILTGYTEYNSDEDCFLLKTNEFGDTLWSISFGDTIDNRGFGLLENPDSTITVAGNNYYTATGDIFLCHLNQFGDTIWLKSYHEDSVMLRFPDICKAANGEMMFYCGTYDRRDSSRRSQVIKLDASGNVLWSKSLGENTNDGTWYKIIPTQDGNFVVASNVLVAGQGDASLIKIDSSGSVIWSMSYDIGYEDIFETVCQTSDGGFILGGYVSYDSIHFGSSLFLIKTDSMGRLQWSKTYNGSIGVYFPFVTEIPGIGYVFSAYIYDPTVTNQIALVKTNLTGDTLSTSRFPGGNGLLFQSASANYDGSFSIHSSKFDGSVWDSYMIKTDEFLNTGCEEYTVDNMTITSDTVKDTSYNAVLVPSSVNINPHQYIFRKGCTSDNICSSVQIDGPDEKRIEIELYPNPADRFITINLPQAKYANVQLYNSTGSLVKVFSHPGNKFQLSVEDLSNGFYFIRIVDAVNVSVSTKVIITHEK